MRDLLGPMIKATCIGLIPKATQVMKALMDYRATKATLTGQLIIGTSMLVDTTT
jgi:hypothetical protein